MKVSHSHSWLLWRCHTLAAGDYVGVPLAAVRYGDVTLGQKAGMEVAPLSDSRLV